MWDLEAVINELKEQTRVPIQSPLCTVLDTLLCVVGLLIT